MWKNRQLGEIKVWARMRDYDTYMYIMCILQTFNAR